MYFRQYGSNEATLKEWSRQLNIVTKGTYPLYGSVENTLNHWRDKLNTNLETNTFGISNNADSTIYEWQNKLNGIYNQ